MSKPNGVPVLIRRTHEERILLALRDGGPLSRSELEGRVGLSRTTVSEITGNLLARGALVEVGPGGGSRGRGRPAARLALDPASGQFLGVDFGHRRVFVAVVNASNDMIGTGAREYPSGSPWDERIAHTLELIDGLERDALVRFGALEAIGVGVPGGSSSTDGGAAAGSPLWAGVSREHVIDSIQARFAEHFDAPVLTDNNVRLAALAEAVWGSPVDVDSLLFIRISDGIGGGLVVGGRLISGSSGIAGELGHVTVNPNGAPCWCGKSGCLETVASIPAILGSLRPANPDIRELADAVAALDRQDVRSLVQSAGRATGAVLGTAATTVDPSEVVVAGDVLRFGSVFLDAVREAFVATAVVSATQHEKVRPTSLSDEAGALGAIAAVFHGSTLLAGYPTLARNINRPHGKARIDA